ncbi:MAG: protein phosphatase 2C domain-containing protein [Betaproteobacteria bacterium]|nr:protein phosphatase 2C domain-containing protein [Betaproteobacteria bacterium]
MPDGGKTKRKALALKCAALTDIGLVRKRNEDSLWVDAKRGWLLLADGMGGHSSGDLAAALAINYVLNSLLVATKGTRDYVKVLANSVVEANAAIRGAGKQSTADHSMGATFVGALLRPGEMSYVYIGDSRLYLLRNGKLTQLSRDHTLVQEFVDAGHLTVEMAQNHPYRGLLTRGLGVHDEAEPDTGICALHPGDRLLLCTDGLTDMVDEHEIARLLGMPVRVDEVAGSLVDAAKSAGGRDNVSVIVAWFDNQPQQDDDRCAGGAHHQMNVNGLEQCRS